MTRARFQPRAWAFVLTCLVCAAAIMLGNWQRSRAAEKQELAARIEEGLRQPPLEISATVAVAAPPIWRRVRLHGEFLAERTVYLDNRIRNGRAGYEILTPLRLASAPAHVLVNRGWTAAAPARDRLPEVRAPAGRVEIEGTAVEHVARVFAPGAAPAGAVRLNLDLADYARESGLALLPFVVEQRSAAEDGLLRDWPRPDAGVEKHLMYAWQWYSLAALAAALFVILSFRRDAYAG